MTDKPKPPAKPDDPEQSKRFIDMAHEVEVDERPEAFDRAFESVAHPNNSPKSSIKKT